MNKKSKNKKDNRNVVEFPQQSKSKALDGARLREAYDAEEKDKERDIDEVSDGIAQYILDQLFEHYGEDFSYSEVLHGINKAYINVLLQLVEDSDYDSDEYLAFFSDEAEEIVNKYVSENDFSVDPVRAAGSFSLASSYIMGIIDDEDDEEG
ncbi:hypothetical protein SAMN06297422_103130 [Lachnospiraceae bacterium]|nr:hypothetical protein SAMN06297422_103130 [Lachnospiraceae bacterium]